jgi:ABC-type dipeptide/oligopeptide/nickel transport system permease component
MLLYKNKYFLNLCRIIGLIFDVNSQTGTAIIQPSDNEVIHGKSISALRGQMAHAGKTEIYSVIIAVLLIILIYFVYKYIRMKEEKRIRLHQRFILNAKTRGLSRSQIGIIEKIVALHEAEKYQ